MIPWARDHRFQRSAYGRAQGDEPQPLEATGLEEELEVDQSITNGGGELRPRWKLGTCWLPGKIGSGDGLAGSRGGVWW